jgi:VPDSG-CTERM motif
MKKLKYVAPILIAVACLGLQHAKADTFSYTLTTGNTPSLGAGPFGTVLVNRTGSSTATITFTAAAGYLFVDGGAVAVNVNAASWSVSAFTVNAGANAVTNDSPRQEDGFGIFNQGGSQQNASNGASSVSFTLTTAPGTWASAVNVLVGNALGNAVAAHIFLVGSNGVTGFATGPGTPSVPDGGATVMLLGMAFGALGMVRRYLVS